MFTDTCGKMTTSFADIASITASTRAISVNGCVQISIDAFIDEMNGEKILAQNEN